MILPPPITTRTHTLVPRPSFVRSLKKSAGDFADQLYQMATDQLIAQVLGQKGDAGGGGYGDAIGSIFGAIFGCGKAGGGDVLSGSRYLVGEDGPERSEEHTSELQ